MSLVDSILCGWYGWVMCANYCYMFCLGTPIFCSVFAYSRYFL